MRLTCRVGLRRLGLCKLSSEGPSSWHSPVKLLVSSTTMPQGHMQTSSRDNSYVYIHAIFYAGLHSPMQATHHSRRWCQQSNLSILSSGSLSTCQCVMMITDDRISSPPGTRNAISYRRGGDRARVFDNLRTPNLVTRSHLIPSPQLSLTGNGCITISAESLSRVPQAETLQSHAMNVSVPGYRTLSLRLCHRMNSAELTQ